jgi:N-dimethylarginine dimethylaminohydrolase
MMWQVSSETGVLTDVLLCRPDHYRWIPTNAVAEHTLLGAHNVDPAAAAAQYAQLVQILESQGVRCHYLTPDPVLPYQVYTRDSSIVGPFGPILSQLRMAERRGETGEIVRFYGGQFWHHASAGSLEGGDVHFIRPGQALIGHSGVRTSQAAAEQLAGRLREAGWQTRLEPFAAHFLHLDVLFCMVSETLAVACSEVLGEDFCAWLQSLGIGIVPASYREVMAMSCNVLSLGANRVVSPAHSVRLNAALREMGVTVLDPPLDCFARGGGSIHCMTMPLRRETGPS